MRIEELFRLLYGVNKELLSLSIIGAGVSEATFVLLEDDDSMEDFLTAVADVVSFSWIVNRLGLRRGVDSFSKNATNASVRLTLLFIRSLPPRENQPPPPLPPLDLSPTFMHSASFKFNTLAMSLRI